MPTADRAGAGFPGHDNNPRSLRRTARHRAVRGQARRNLPAMEEGHDRASEMPERRGQARRNQHGGERLRMASQSDAADVPESSPTATRDYYLHTIEKFGPRAMHVREQLPGRPRFVLVPGAVERVQAESRPIHAPRRRPAVQSHRSGGLSPEDRDFVLALSAIPRRSPCSCRDNVHRRQSL